MGSLKRKRRCRCKRSKGKGRALIERNLRKGQAKPSVDFIKKILDDAYESGLAYDVRDLRSDILGFAAKSTNQAPACIKAVQSMQFVGQGEIPDNDGPDDKPLVFYDVEVYPNLFVVCWKIEGDNSDVVRMINPTPNEIEELFSQRLVGFNNRRYDNHILYARFLGYNNEELYQLSNKIINSKNELNILFGGLQSLICRYLVPEKKSLKTFMIELDSSYGDGYSRINRGRINWDKVVNYCVNDVLLLAVFNNPKQDFVARKILADFGSSGESDHTEPYC